MRTQLSHTVTRTGVGSVSTGNHLMSVAQQALTDIGWEDLRPAIYAAEQMDHAITEELKAAHTAYREEPEEFRRQRLKIARNPSIGTFSDVGFTIAWQSSSQLSTTPGWDVYAQRLSGNLGDWNGFSVSSAGDINGDGYLLKLQHRFESYKVALTKADPEFTSETKHIIKKLESELIPAVRPDQGSHLLLERVERMMGYLEKTYRDGF